MKILVRDLYDDLEDFEILLMDAKSNAKTDWEMHFCDDLQDRYDVYEDRMYLSNRQAEILERLAGVL